MQRRDDVIWRSHDFMWWRHAIGISARYWYRRACSIMVSAIIATDGIVLTLVQTDMTYVAQTCAELSEN